MADEALLKDGGGVAQCELLKDGVVSSTVCAPSPNRPPHATQTIHSPSSMPHCVRPTLTPAGVGVKSPSVTPRLEMDSARLRPCRGPSARDLSLRWPKAPPKVFITPRQSMIWCGSSRKETISFRTCRSLVWGVVVYQGLRTHVGPERTHTKRARPKSNQPPPQEQRHTDLFTCVAASQNLILVAGVLPARSMMSTGAAYSWWALSASAAVSAAAPPGPGWACVVVIMARGCGQCQVQTSTRRGVPAWV